MIPSSTEGWHLPDGTRLAAMMICVPTCLVGALLTISFFWTVVGFPVLTFATLGIHGLRRASEVGATHPAWPLVALAIVEAAVGALGLIMFGSMALFVLLPIFACSAITGLVGWVTVKTAVPCPSPPPPLPTWHQPSGQPS